MAVGRKWTWWLALLAMVSLVGCGGPKVETTARAASSSAGAGAPAVGSLNTGSATGALPAAGPLHYYTAEQTHRFLSAAKAAEAIDDPVRRCLAYPDPPGSHWPRDTIIAYCHYHLQRVISVPEIERLIRTGHASELDQQLSAAQAQQGTGSAYGLLDETYKRDFGAPTADLRILLDRWKHDSPRSAFAFAASGYAYVAEADKARGNDWVENTPLASLQTMEDLIRKSDVDLHRAIELDSKLAPVYIAMLKIGNMAKDDAYLGEVGRQALKAVPDDYSVYSYLLVAAEPKWHGSLKLMEQIAALSQKHVAENPLLGILPAEEPFYVIDNCNCGTRAQISEYPALFDQPSTAAHLARAGLVARDNPLMAVVYLSEALRFDPTMAKAWEMAAERSMRLTSVGEPDWGLAEAGKVLETHPDYAGAVKAQAFAYEALGQIGPAESALKRATMLDPSDIWALAELGDLYIERTQELDKAEHVADQLIGSHRGDPRGWVMRASIQNIRHDPGLDDTLRYFITHFGDDPAQQATVAQMRGDLAEEAKMRGERK